VKRAVASLLVVTLAGSTSAASPALKVKGLFKEPAVKEEHRVLAVAVAVAA